MSKPRIKSYQEALEYLKGKQSRPYANNTRIELDSLGLGHEVITVKYHDNPIVNFYPDRVSFDSCGWKTSTTKERLNWFMPDNYMLYQERSIWYISKGYGMSRYVFQDGITIKDGQVYNAGNEEHGQEVKRMIKRIKKYVSGYVSALLAGEVGQPSSADCWHCLMRDESGKTLGELTNSNHIESHMEESYYVPSLLGNAFKFNSRLCPLAQDGIARLTSGESISEWQADIVARDVKSCLTAYLKHALGLAQ